MVTSRITTAPTPTLKANSNCMAKQSERTVTLGPKKKNNNNKHLSTRHMKETPLTHLRIKNVFS